MKWLQKMKLAAMALKLIRRGSQVSSHKANLCSFRTPRQPELQDIRKKLGANPGGSVDLIKDEETGIAVLTLNNPEKKNSITNKMLSDLSLHLSALENWSSGKGLIVMGAAGEFCSGGDSDAVLNCPVTADEITAFMIDCFARLNRLPLISVALVQGHALGGGAELCVACDFRVMAASARIGFIHLKVGITACGGGTTRLIRLLGRQKTLELFCSAKLVSAEEALHSGLVDRVLPHSLSPSEEFVECKKWILSTFCKYDSHLIQAVKSTAVYSDLNPDIDMSTKYEREISQNFGKTIFRKFLQLSNLNYK